MWHCIALHCRTEKDESTHFTEKLSRQKIPVGHSNVGWPHWLSVTIICPQAPFFSHSIHSLKKSRNWFDENFSQNSRITAIVTAAFPAVTASLPPIYTVVSFSWCNFKRAEVTMTLACIILSSISNPLSTLSQTALRPFSNVYFRKSRLNQAGSILITLSTTQMENLVDRSSLSLSYTWEAKA